MQKHVVAAAPLSAVSMATRQHSYLLLLLLLWSARLLLLLLLHLSVLTLFHHHHHHLIAVIKTSHRRHVIVAAFVTVTSEPETETGFSCRRHRAGGHCGRRSDYSTTIIILALLLAGRPIAPQTLLWRGIVTVVTAVIVSHSSYPRIVIRVRRLH